MLVLRQLWYLIHFGHRRSAHLLNLQLLEQLVTQFYKMFFISFALVMLLFSVLRVLLCTSLIDHVQNLLLAH